ncbi:cytochrome P450 93A3-like [Senna tora]|uniref:Cytochrome P450 93A3-like n=1 Tax=Senna tora TaxID=362788 RepID=A0A834WVK9_9FABA|nr:cytochrome P450 93A3-like [Senna tora]
MENASKRGTEDKEVEDLRARSVKKAKSNGEFADQSRIQRLMLRSRIWRMMIAFALELKRKEWCSQEHPKNMSAEFLSYIHLILISILFPILIRPILIRSRRSKSDGPPSPPSLPLIGHHLLPPIPHHSFHNLSSCYGPVLQLLLSSVPCFIASTPDATKHFLKTHESSFSDRFPNANIQHLSYDSQGFLFRAYGLHRKFMKKLCMTRLLGGPTLHLLHHVRRTDHEVPLVFAEKSTGA